MSAVSTCLHEAGGGSLRERTRALSARVWSRVRVGSAGRGGGDGYAYVDVVEVLDDDVAENQDDQDNVLGPSEMAL